MSQAGNGRRADALPRHLSVVADPRKPEALALGDRVRKWLIDREAFAEDPASADVQLVIGGAVYGAGLLWAYFSNRALRTGELVVKLEPGPNAASVVTEAVETYQGDV